jgi:hypothetical protein
LADKPTPGNLGRDSAQVFFICIYWKKGNLPLNPFAGCKTAKEDLVKRRNQGLPYPERRLPKGKVFKINGFFSFFV